MSKKYRIKEIFGPTFQGEGSNVGRAVHFLRFAGCNKWSGLAKDKAASICNYCDTDFRGGTHMDSNEIILALLALGSPDVKTIVISGGEPTLQLDENLCAALKLAGFDLHLETNGSKNIDHLEQYLDHITCSPKQIYEETKLRRADDLKLLFPWIKSGISARGFIRFVAKNYYIQPVERDGDAISGVKDCLALISTELPWYRLSLQTHKIAGIK